MRDVLDELLAVWRAGGTAGVATVVRTIKSAPRPPGAAMVVAPDGTVAGSVSGGCVEAAVYELANEVVRTGRPELQRYGITDDDAFAVGLTCGGIIDIFAEPVSRNTFPSCRPSPTTSPRTARPPSPPSSPIPTRVGSGAGWSSATDAVEGSLGSARADDAVADDARGLLAAGRTAVLSYGPDGQRQDAGMEVFVASHAPRPRMLIFGAIDFAVGARPAGRVPRIPGHGVRRPAGVRDAGPVPRRRRGRRRLARPLSRRASTTQGAIDATHRDLRADPRPQVRRARAARWRCGCPRSATSARWGRGAPTTTGMDRLREVGLTDAELDRLSSPIGLDLGARTPEETAVSIAAEIIARRWGGGGRPLAEVDGRIHHDGLDDDSDER